MNRRELMQTMAGGAFALMAGEVLTGETLARGPAPYTGRGKSRVALIRTADRASEVKKGHPAP